MDIFIDIETLRSPEAHRLQILENVKANFKAPSTLNKGQAAIDLGLTDAGEIKFTSKDDMIARWEKELASVKGESVANSTWEKTSFDPDVAPIACICTHANGYKQQFDLIDFKSESMMLSEFHEYINALCAANGAESIRKPNFVGHNIAKFDLPFIWKRSVINNVATCKAVKWIDARHGQNCYDTMIAWAGFGKTISADNLCKILGVKGKTEGMDGSKVYDTWQTDPHKVIEYCHDDVQLVKEIHARLTK
jgi:hypothetical protein